MLELNPSHLVAVFDSPPPSFRNELDPNYKANRGAPPEDLVPQFDVVLKLCRAAGIPSYLCQGYEADDLVAAFAHRARTEGLAVTIISNDKDINQLVTNDAPCISRYNLKKGSVVDVQAVFDAVAQHRLAWERNRCGSKHMWG